MTTGRESLSRPASQSKKWVCSDDGTFLRVVSAWGTFEMSLDVISMEKDLVRVSHACHMITAWSSPHADKSTEVTLSFGLVLLFHYETGFHGFLDFFLGTVKAVVSPLEGCWLNTGRCFESARNVLHEFGSNRNTLNLLSNLPYISL